MAPARRSLRIAHIKAENLKKKLKKTKNQKQHSILDRIPRKIRHEILSLLLTYPEQLAFTRRGSFNLWRTQHSSAHIRLCRWNHCERHDASIRALLSTFSALCTLSTAMRSECRAIFFAENKWVLHGAEYSNFDAMEFFCGNWGGEAFGCDDGCED